MNRPVIYLWLNSSPGARLKKAQCLLEASVQNYGLDPIRYPAGRKLVEFGKVLATARRQATGRGLVWCNSDVTLTRDPFEVPNPDQVYGFHRREVPSGEITLGVDMFYIPIKEWDEVISADIPRLFLGASYVDRWIPRLMQKIGRYENLVGYIDHVTHEQSAASGKDADPYYQANFKAYNRWARRNGLDPIAAPPYLMPGVGHVWGVRDGLNRLKQRLLKTPRGT